MIRGREIFGALLLFAVLLTAGACSSGRLIRQEDVDSAGRLALVSVVVPGLSASGRESDRKVLQAAADHAAGEALKGLAGVRPWKLLDAEAVGRSKAARSFGKVSAGDLEALFPREEDRRSAQSSVAVDLAAWREGFVGADGMPAVPRAAFAADQRLDKDRPAARAVLLQQAGKLCHELGVDAAAFIEVRYAVTHPRENAFIVTEGRTDGLLSLTATLVIVDKTGRIIVDMGPRPIDARSPSRDMLPLYRGAGREAVAAANIDLADPQKKVQRAFLQLTDEAMADLAAGLKEELKQ